MEEHRKRQITATGTNPTALRGMLASGVAVMVLGLPTIASHRSASASVLAKWSLFYSVFAAFYAATLFLTVGLLVATYLLPRRIGSDGRPVRLTEIIQRLPSSASTGLWVGSWIFWFFILLFLIFSVRHSSIYFNIYFGFSVIFIYAILSLPLPELLDRDYRWIDDSVILPVVIASLGTLAILVVTTPHGTGVSPDSVDYVSTARNLAQGLGFTAYNGFPFVSFPPLFPALLAIGELIGVGAYETARVINAIALGCVILLTGFLTRDIIGTGPWATIACALSLVSIPLISVSQYAWTEILFIVIQLAFLSQMVRYARAPHIRYIISGILLGTLSALMRYIGVIYIGLLILFIFIYTKDSLLRRVRKSLLSGSLACIPIGLWLIRNLWVSGSLAGPRHPSNLSLLYNLALALWTILGWIFPRPSTNLLGVAAIIVLIIGLWTIAKMQKRGRVIAVGDILHHIITHRGLTVIGISFLVYSGYLVVTSSIIGFDRINDRLLSPAFPLVLILSLSAVRTLLWGPGGDARPASHNPCSHGHTTALILTLVLAGYPLVRTAAQLRSSLVGGLGYASARWTQSAVAALAKAQCSPLSIYSNSPDGLYWSTGMQARFTPRARPHASDVSTKDEELARFTELAAEEPVCIVWFDGNIRGYLMPMAEVLSHLPQVREIPADDGAIYISNPH